MSAGNEHKEDIQQLNIIFYFLSLHSAVKCETFSCSSRRSAAQEMEVLEGSV
jgi:hypothetical protein